MLGSCLQLSSVSSANSGYNGMFSLADINSSCYPSGCSVFRQKIGYFFLRKTWEIFPHFLQLHQKNWVNTTSPPGHLHCHASSTDSLRYWRHLIGYRKLLPNSGGLWGSGQGIWANQTRRNVLNELQTLHVIPQEKHILWTSQILCPWQVEGF